MSDITFNMRSPFGRIINARGLSTFNKEFEIIDISTVKFQFGALNVLLNNKIIHVFLRNVKHKITIVCRPDR